MEAQVCNSGLFVTRERLLWAWSLEHTPGFHIVASSYQGVTVDRSECQVSHL